MAGNRPNGTVGGGGPPRVAVPQKGSKPLYVVTDDHGAPVVDGRRYLAWHGATGTYYVGRTEPRHYLRTTDRLLAIHRFREWAARQSGEQTVLADEPATLGGKPVTVESLLAVTAETLDAVFAGKLAVKGARRITVPSADFWGAVRKVALQDPARFRRETGLTVSDERPPPSATLDAVLGAYLSRRKKPSASEQHKVRRYWSEFVRRTGAVTVRDVTVDGITAWEGAAYLPYHDGGSPKTLHHRFDYVMRILRYAAVKNLDAGECRRVIGELQSRRAELPSLRNPNPQPISRQDFAALLAVADKRWRAMLLTALNLCYYGCDLRTLPKSAIDKKTGWVIFDRKKTGGTTRVGVLWRRTLKALKEYERAEPHDGETVFITQYSAPYSADGLRTAYHLLRDKAGVTAELCHIRDGAYSAAVQGGADLTHARILAGHKIGGMTDAYVKSNPAMVADACAAIERHYFG